MKFYGNIGFSDTIHIGNGVYEEGIVAERPYYGEVVRNSVNQQQGDMIIPGMTLGNTFNIVADAYAQENIDQMRYIEWRGTLWTIKQVVDEYGPRLTIRPGEVYHGPTYVAPADPAGDHEGDTP